MARSGSQTTWSSNGGYFLKVTWSETSQSISNNTTSIEVKLYFGCKSGWSISDSTNSYTLTIDGTTYSGSDVNISTSTSGDLITTRTRTITHNSDGRKSITIDASISGLYFGGISLSAFTATFDTIPRASSITSSANWTAGYPLKVSISRFSSSFDHNVTVKVRGTTVASATGVGTSVTFDSTTFHKDTLTEIAQDAGGSTEIIITTKDGSTTIGSSDSKTGTVSAPDASTISAGNFNIGSNRSYTINRGMSEYTHTVKLIMGGTTIDTMTGVTESSTVVFSSAQNDTMYSKTPNSNSISYYFEITSYYSGVQVRNPRTSSTYKAYVVNADPTPPTTVTYVDENTAITAITGNSSNIVQSKSTVGVTFNAGVAIKGATISKYYVTGTGASSPKTTTTVTKQNIGTLNASSNATVSVTVEDSRGNKGTKTIPVTIIPYKAPTLSSEATRLDNFQASTTIDFKGTYSPVVVGGVTKNAITSLTYKSKVSSSATYGANSANIAVTATGTNFTATRVTSFANTASYDIQITVVDKFNSSYTQTITISSGQPLFFLDTLNSAVGINTFPEPLLTTIDPANVALDIGITHGRVSFFSKPSVASNNEVTLRIQPADDLSDNKTGLHLFARRDSFGFHSSKDNTTFMRYTNLNNTNTATTGEPRGSLKLLAQTNLDLYAKTYINLIVEDSDGTPVNILKANGTVSTSGVPIEFGGGGNMHIVAGEPFAPITSYKNANGTSVGVGSEALLLETNGLFFISWDNNEATGSDPMVNRTLRGDGGTFGPTKSGNVNLGSTSLRWGTIYTDTAVNSSSDSRLKEKIKNINNIQYSGFSKERSAFSPELVSKLVRDMPIYEYEYITAEEKDHGKKQIGIMADIILEKDKTGIANYFVYNNNEDGEYTSLSTQSYASILHIALQEEMKKTEKLSNELIKISKRLEMLEK